MTREITGSHEDVLIRDSDVSGSRFTNVNLEKSSFDDVSLRGASFHNVNLSTASFSDINFSNASIKHANLSGMTINGTLVSDLVAAHRAEEDPNKPSAVIFAGNVTALAHFYELVASMAIVHRDAEHVVLDSKHFQLVIHAIPGHRARKIDVGEPSQVRENVAVKLCFPVASIADARAKAAGAGGLVGPVAKEWEARGFRACDGHDPEGNVVQFRERL